MTDVQDPRVEPVEPMEPVHPVQAGEAPFPLGVLVRLSVGAHALTASGSGAVPSRTVALDPPLRGGEDPGPSLHRALATLESDGGWDPSDHPVIVALLPPLAEARVVSLPPLPDGEAELVLRRDASRHFVGAARGSVVVAVGPHDPEVGGRMAALASQALAETLLRVLRSRGYRPETLEAAQGGWAELGRATGAGLVAAIVPGASAGVDAAGGDAAGGTAAVGAANLHLLHLENGRPVATRRIPLGDPSDLEEALAHSRAGEPGRAVVLRAPSTASPEVAHHVAASLAAAGWRVVDPPDGHDAATGAAPVGPGAPGTATARLAFLPPSLMAVHRERNRRQAVRLGAAAFLLLLLAAAVHFWGAAAELRAVERERALLADAVAPALVLRDSLDRMEERLASLRELGEESRRWTFALVEIAMILPPDAHLTAFRAAGDTVALEGSGGRAGDALAALRGSSSFRDARVEGVIQRELGEGGTSAERYTLSALLADPRASRGNLQP